MPERTLRVGVVGCGDIANAHLPYVLKAGGLVVGLVDSDVTASNRLADQFGVQSIYRRVEDLIESEKPDVVHVLTPPHTHAAVACAVLERGVHTLVEKPLATTTIDVERIRSAAARGGALVTVDHNRLFDPPMLRLQSLRESGDLGEIVAVESYQAATAGDRNWLHALPGGALGDLLTHHIYLHQALLGPIMSVDAGAKYRGEFCEELRVVLQSGGASGTITISMRGSPKISRLRVYGTRKSAEIYANAMAMVTRRDYDLPKLLAKPMPSLDEALQLVQQTASTTLNFVLGRVRYYPGMGEVIRRFYDAVRSGSAPPVTMEHAAETVSISEEIFRASGGATRAAYRGAELTAGVA
jgi:predicted dehydrogenase